MTVFLHFTIFFKISIVGLIQKYSSLVSVIHCKNINLGISSTV